MRVEVNGEPQEVDRGMTLGRLVDGRVADRRGVAAAVDGDVVPRRDWDDTPLQEGATVEVVAAVQGGCA